MFKKHLFFLFIFFATFLSSQVKLKEIANFGTNPGNLKLFAVNDSNKIETRSKPLVLVLHGCSQGAFDINEITDWSTLANKNNFVVLFPQQKLINNVSLCFNWMIENDINKTGECLSIYQMMRYAIDTLNIDSTKIFLYGVSAGACMSEVLCANYPWLINKAAICAGIPFRTATGLNTVQIMGKTIERDEKTWGDLVRSQNSEYKGKYPGIILVHGTQDFVADYGYASEMVKQWTNVLKIPVKPTFKDTVFNGNKKVHRYIYGDKTRTEAMVFYKIIGMGHKVPVDIGTGESKGGKDKLFSEDIDFFSTYYIAKDFGLIK